MSTFTNLDYKKLAWRCHWFVIPMMFLVPIYTDEVTYKLLYARNFFDGAPLQTLFPQCFYEDRMPEVLFFFWPFRLFDHILFGWHYSPLFMRITSCVSALIICALIAKLAKNLYGRDEFPLASMMALSLLIPYMLNFSRPEMMLIVFVFAALIMGTHLHLQRQTPKGQAFLVCGIIFCYMGMLAYHSKCIWFFPLLFLVIGFAPVQTWLKSLGLVSLILSTVVQIRYADSLLQCEAAPENLAILGRQVISPSTLIKDPIAGFKQAWDNFLRSDTYFRSVQYRPAFMSSWLPQSTYQNGFTDFLNLVAKIIVWLFLILITFTSIRSLWNTIRLRAQLDDIILSGIIIFFVGLTCIQTQKNAYESSLFVPVFILASIIALHKCQHRFPGIHRRVLVACTFLALLSIGMNAAAFRSPYQQWMTKERLSMQEFSHTLRYYYDKQPIAKDLYEKCGMPQPEKMAHHLVVDDVTYGYFQKSQRPYHILYVTGKWGEGVGRDLIKFLRDRKSSGILTRCEKLSGDLQQVSLKSGDFCCIRL